ncbi:hypothetical protein [Romboutsia lituseburensis]|uniref:hypothetical protein n=1 Tax=Romboutsia lituseburensis TaxID=1537 RepID=UPI00215AB494|nr:hypothetical protein [Romboutsia lituseburensis]MCR8746288.1 hypothetical protein [Romboutsia lituseburensis]
MKVDLQKMVSSFSCPEELEALRYFKQFNVYETVNLNIDAYKKGNDRNNLYRNSYYNNQEIRISKIESTIPSLNIVSTKIINTMEGTSLEGQHLTGKKLVVLGEISLSLLVTYYINCNKCNNIVKEVKIPFSTFIVIPKDTCNEEIVNLRYLIEDISTAPLDNSKAIVSITLLIQYLEEH